MSDKPKSKRYAPMVAVIGIGYVRRTFRRPLMRDEMIAVRDLNLAAGDSLRRVNEAIEVMPKHLRDCFDAHAVLIALTKVMDDCRDVSRASAAAASGIASAHAAIAKPKAD